jgi:hypothetical protein
MYPDKERKTQYYRNNYSSVPPVITRRAKTPQMTAAAGIINTTRLITFFSLFGWNEQVCGVEKIVTRGV